MKLSLSNQINRKMSRHLSYDTLIELTFLITFGSVKNLARQIISCFLEGIIII